MKIVKELRNAVKQLAIQDGLTDAQAELLEQLANASDDELRNSTHSFTIAFSYDLHRLVKASYLMSQCRSHPVHVDWLIADFNLSQIAWCMNQCNMHIKELY